MYIYVPLELLQILCHFEVHFSKRIFGYYIGFILSLLSMQNRKVITNIRRHSFFIRNAKLELTGGARGELVVKDPIGKGLLEFHITLRCEEERRICFEAPIFQFPADETTLYFDPNTGGSLRNRTTPFHSLYPAEASLCATFAYNQGQTGLGFGHFNQEQKRI